MITGISGPLTKWVKVRKRQATPAFPVPFVSRNRWEEFQILLKSNKDPELVLFVPVEGQSATSFAPGKQFNSV